MLATIPSARAVKFMSVPGVKSGDVRKKGKIQTSCVIVDFKGGQIKRKTVFPAKISLLFIKNIQEKKGVLST